MLCGGVLVSSSDLPRLLLPKLLLLFEGLAAPLDALVEEAPVLRAELSTNPLQHVFNSALVQQERT